LDGKNRVKAREENSSLPYVYPREKGDGNGSGRKSRREKDSPEYRGKEKRPELSYRKKSRPQGNENETISGKKETSAETKTVERNGRFL